MKRLSLWWPWRSTKAPHRTRPNDRRPRLEPLEGRDVPSTLFTLNPIGNRLVRFESAAPGERYTSVAITGLQGGATEHIVGIDFRPRTGQLYALGVVYAAGTDTLRLYTLNPLTGAATRAGTATPSVTPGDNLYGFDFDPSADLLRVVNTSNVNLRLNPNTGALVSTDTPLNPTSYSVVGSAYDRNFDGKLGAAGTTLYALSYSSTSPEYTLLRQGGLNQSPSPNGGALTPVGSLGVTVGPPFCGFDIAASGSAAGTGLAVISDTTTERSSLYSINLSTGAATHVGPIGDIYYPYLVGLAIAPSSTLAVSAVGTAVTAVRVFDGFTSRLIRASTPFPGFTGEVRVAMADVNRDAVPDLIAAASVNAHVKVFDGVTNGLIHTFIAFPGYFGSVALAAGDVNGDGFDDIIVSADGAPGGHVRAFSGADLTWLANFLSFPGYGDRVSLAASDFNRDGIDEIVTAVGSSGHVQVFTRAGKLFSTPTFFGSFLTFQGYTGPISLTAGDVNGDGLADVIVGTAVGRGHVKAFSGANNALVSSFYAFGASNPNGVQVAVADFDRDGRLEIRAAPGRGRDLEVRTFNAVTQELLNVFEPFDSFLDGAYLAGARG